MYAAAIRPNRAEELKLRFEALKEQELNQVSGGMGQEEEDEAVITAIITAVILAIARIILGTIIPDTFEEFYRIMINNEGKVIAAIAAACWWAAIVYKKMSNNSKRKLLKNVYKALGGKVD